MNTYDMKIFIFYLILFILYITPGYGFPLNAEREQFYFEQRNSHKEKNEDLISAREIADRIQSLYPNSKIIDIHETKDQYGHESYAVKLLTKDGKRIDILVDARNGSIIEERGK